MAKKFILATFYSIASFPFILISYILNIFNVWGLKNDLALCLHVIEKQKHNNLSNHLTNILIIAEDRRNLYHKGVDHIALLRAIYVRLAFGTIQGASTIEQQFVRVVTQRYERKLSRKLREQFLATAVLARSSKKNIAISYLSISFYGSGLYGISGLRKVCSEPLSKVSISHAIKAIARLKYPEPKSQDREWKEKILLRDQYINQQLYKPGNRDRTPHY